MHCPSLFKKSPEKQEVQSFDSEPSQVLQLIWHYGTHWEKLSKKNAPTGHCLHSKNEDPEQERQQDEQF